MLEEVKKARDDISKNPNLAMFWNPILSKITPSFLERCEWAVKDANGFIEKTLRENMFSGLEKDAQDKKISDVAQIFANNEGRARNTHIQFEQCHDAGLNVTRLEDDQKLQDIVLTLHHCYMHSLGNTTAFKIIENHLGRAMIRQQAVQFMQAPMSLGPSGPS